MESYTTKVCPVTKSSPGVGTEIGVTLRKDGLTVPCPI